MQEENLKPFNPLDKVSLANTVGDKLLSQSLKELPPAPFSGAGIYAIYYVGSFPLYKNIARYNQVEAGWPIYVGKAIPKGGRKGLITDRPLLEQVLYRRLKEHAKSIEESANLQLKDFRCRVLVVDDIWIPLGESLLIQKFQPLWNIEVDGFGNHAPGGGRGGQRISSWDTLHPGRPWAKGLPSKINNLEEYHQHVSDFIEKVERKLF